MGNQSENQGRMNKFINILTITAIFLFVEAGLAQKKIFHFSTDPLVEGDQASLLFKNNFGGPIKVKSAKLKVVSEFKDGYKWGNGSEGAPFRYEVKFLLNKIGIAGTAHSFFISNNSPQGYYYLDLQEYILPNLDDVGLSFEGVEISQIDFRPIEEFKEVEEALTLRLSFEIEYGIPHVNGNTLDKPIIVGKELQLGWTPTDFKWSPGYEVQFLRLYNYDENKIKEDNITTKIDWSKSLSYLIEEPIERMAITMAEGSGYYAWRVRSIGTLGDGGFANSANYGTWSAESPKDGNTLFLTPSTVSKAIFFIKDPDEDKNYSYNRVFAEKELVKEGATYATTLNQVKQAQVYLPSKNTTLITQTTLDYLGRPALTTIPGPVVGKTKGFVEEVLLDEEGKLYTAKQFDGEDTYTHPKKVQLTGNNPLIFNYYSNENPDLRIPDAEGYPFTRVRFANDGTGRVIEQSGIGKTHMLGKQDEGFGRTVRAFYGTPSQEELIALFGDEAPDNEKVIKIVNLDQNNTASISYKNLNGQVLATSLTFNDNSDALKPVDNYESNPILVKDKLTSNAQCEGDFVNTKRLAFPEKTTLTLSYKVKCATLDGLCVGGDVNCGYMVYLSIHNVLTGETIQLPKDGQPNLDDASCEDGFKIIDFEAENLEAGEYVIQKHLARAKPVVEGAEEEIENSIMPIGAFIQDRLEEVKCSGELLTFYNDLLYLSKVLNGNQDILANTPLPFDCEKCSKKTYQFPEEFIEKYNKDRDAYELHLYDKDGKDFEGEEEILLARMPAKAGIISACCNIDLNVFYDPPFDCPSHEQWTEFIKELNEGTKDLDQLEVDPHWHENRYDPIDNGFLLDLEGYALSLIRESNPEEISVEKAAEILYKNMAGWHVPGTFNQMVFHMLTDQYTSTGMGENAASCDRKGAENDCQPGGATYYKAANYTCCEILGCWRSLVQLLIQKDKLDLSSVSEHDNLTDAMDEQLGKDSINNHFDDNFSLLGSIKLLFKKKISKKIRDIKTPTPSFDQHLVHEFLNCTGYKFADILNPNNPGSPSKELTADSKYKDEPCFINLEYDFDEVKGNGEYDVDNFFGELFKTGKNRFNLKSEYFQVKNGANHKWNELIFMPDKGGGKKISENFPYIQHPIYAFKYFEYARGTYPTLEFATCFEDPNLCEVNGEIVPCCPDEENQECYFCGVGEVTCAYTKENWTSAQRDTYYKMLKGRQNVENEKPTPIETINCNWANEEHEWFIPKDDEQQVSLKYITKEVYEDIHGIALLGTKANLKNLKGEEVDEMSYAEIKAVEMRDQCESRCDSRRGEFRDSVISMFERRCYILTECKLESEDDTYTWEDVEAITEEIYGQCISQCPITTYYCRDRNCRMADRKYTSVGNDSEDLELHMGIAGRPGLPGTENDCPPGLNNEETNNCSGYDKDVLSWSEFTKWHQAQNWKPELRIPTKCEGDDDYDPRNCDNPDTFVEKEKYYVHPGGVPVAIDRQSVAVKKAISPKINIQVEVGED